MTLGGAGLAPHDHVCVLHRGRRQREELVLPFLSEGLECGEPALFFTPTGESAAVRAALGDPDNLELLEPEDSYVRAGAFEPDQVFEVMDTWARERLCGGDVFGRVVSDMSWAASITSTNLVAEIIAEEQAGNGWCRSYNQVVICLFDLDLFGGDLVVPMIRSHPKTWLSGVVIENPGCV